LNCLKSLVIQAKVPIGELNDLAETALHIAVKSKQPDGVIRYLAQVAPSLLDAEDCRGKTVFEYA
jgi:hypothetical protein